MKKTFKFKYGKYKIEAEASFAKGVFSASVWLEEGGNFLCGGQAFDDVLATVPGLNNDAVYMKLYKLWKVYHLNDLHAGTMKQEGYLRAYEQWYGVKLDANNYDKACEVLKEAGLFEDEGVKYGHSWVKWEIPGEAVAEIKELLGGGK